MTLSYRISVPQLHSDRQFNLLVEFLRRHREAVDELSLFTEGSYHGYYPLDEFAEWSRLLGQRVETLHAEGFTSVGINMLVTLGHGEAGENFEELPFQALVGHDGRESHSCACPNSPEFRDYIRRKYRMIAEARPDFIWVDDDVRMWLHGAATYACFCPLCIRAFGRGMADREQLVATLDAPQSRDLRRAWIEHNATVVERLLSDIYEAVVEANANTDIGLMTVIPSLDLYSGQAFDRWMGALRGHRVRPGGGFYTDDSPRQMIAKTLDVGRQCVQLPSSVTDIQYELENFPCQKLDKSVHTVLNECTLALAAGCNGIAFSCVKPELGPLDDGDALLEAISRERGVWDQLVEASTDLPMVGVWPAHDNRIIAERAVGKDGWFATMSDPAYDISGLNGLAEVGIPLTLDRESACVTLLAGRMAEVFDDEELRGILSSGVMLDPQALETLWERGLGELTGVRPGRSCDFDAWEQFTEHPLNGRYAGDCRDVRLHTFPSPAVELVPVADGVEEIARLIRNDGWSPEGLECGMCLSTFTNDLGGRIVAMGYGPWTRLTSGPKRAQIHALADWASGGRLPVVIERTVRVMPLVRMSPDRQRLVVVLLNTGYDPTGPLDLLLRAECESVDLLRPQGPIPLPAHRRDNHLCVPVPEVPPWQTITLVGH